MQFGTNTVARPDSGDDHELEVRRQGFIAPSLPLQGDQAVDAHAARAPPPPYSGGRVWSIVLNGGPPADLLINQGV